MMRLDSLQGLPPPAAGGVPADDTSDSSEDVPLASLAPPARPSEAPTQPYEALTQPYEAPTQPYEAPTQPHEALTQPYVGPDAAPDAEPDAPEAPPDAPEAPPDAPDPAAPAAPFAVGALVVAPALTGVGENFEGGLAEVTAVDAARGTVDVRLTIGGARQRGIAASRVAAFALDAPRRKRQTAGRCRLFGCACLIVDCGHAQPDELAAAPRAPADARARRDLEAAAQALGLDADGYDSSSSEDVPLAALGRPPPARAADGLSESDDDAAAAAAALLRARPLHPRNAPPAKKRRRTRPAPPAGGDAAGPDGLARPGRRLPRKRRALKREIREIHAHLERTAVPYLRGRVGRLERRVSAQKLARRRTGALDAAEAAGIRRELDELRDLVLGTVRRGVDVADRIYRRLEDGAARRGAASEGLAALALATERVERDIHGLARRLKGIRDEDPRDDDGFAAMLEREDGPAPGGAPRRRGADGAARRRRAARGAARRPPRRAPRPEAPGELAPAGAAAALREIAAVSDEPVDAPWPAHSSRRARAALAAREIGRLARGVADAARDEADAAARGGAAAADAAAKLARAAEDDDDARAAAAAAVVDAAPAAAWAARDRSGPAADALAAVADAGAALGALPAEALCVALVDGAAHYSVRALVDGDEASRAAARRWRRCDAALAGGAVAWLARRAAGDERAFWTCLVFAAAALQAAPDAAWAAGDFAGGALDWACAAAAALARVRGGGRGALLPLQARCAAACADDARWDRASGELLALARRGAGGDAALRRVLRRAPAAAAPPARFADAAEAIVGAAKAGSQRTRLVTGLLAACDAARTVGGRDSRRAGRAGSRGRRAAGPASRRSRARRGGGSRPRASSASTATASGPASRCSTPRRRRATSPRWRCWRSWRSPAGTRRWRAAPARGSRRRRARSPRPRSRRWPSAATPRR